MYCPNCYLLVNDKKCPVCGSKNLREPVSDDYCFLVEKELIYRYFYADRHSGRATIRAG